MCGIAGIVDFLRRDDPDTLLRQVSEMSSLIAHRGPDDDGLWCHDHCALAHRRLAVIDTSAAGHQPMVSASGRYVIVYNGEVYNYREIADTLPGGAEAVVGGSDTAVLLAGFEAWGIDATVRRTVGMFAFAVWDRKTSSLTLGRDRLGIKPLYWAKSEGSVGFASQLDALRAPGRFDVSIDRQALASFSRLGYVPAPYTIFDGMRKLEPGTMVTFQHGADPAIEQYWNIRSVALNGLRNRSTQNYSDARDTLHDLLKRAVSDRMISDVPLGSFLSGGIDSSTVTALMQASSSSPVRTFSIGFDELGYDESVQAEQVATHLGTEHETLRATPLDARNLIADLPRWFDEPFADSSQLPTLLLSRMTREHVTVALSGDGGDEVFAGYNRYLWPARIRQLTEWMPLASRRGLARALSSVSPDRWDRCCAALLGRKAPSQAGEKIHKAAGVLTDADLDDTYLRLVSQWPTNELPVVKPMERPAGSDIGSDPALAGLGPRDRMRLRDMLSYLPDDILTKVDRASMAYALEARVPLLDHRVVEYAWTLPEDHLVHNGRGKHVLRDILRRYVPANLVERPKMGFGVPIHEWLRGPLREWASDLLSPARLSEQGFFDSKTVDRAWSAHLSGSENHQYALWTVLMFQSWHDYHMLGRREAA